MKRIITLAVTVLMMLSLTIPAFAAETQSVSSPEVSVTVTSPKSIDSVPIFEDNIVIYVKNLTDRTLSDLACFLMIVDKGRGETYPVDEFGENAYQTRSIDSLAPGEETTVTIPVRVMYVGDFRFTASVIDYTNNSVITGDAIDVKMTATSKLDKTLVMVVSAVVPVALAIGAFLLTKGKKKKKS